MKSTVKKVKSKAPKGVSVQLYYRVLIIQSLIIAVVGGVAVYSILKVGMLRDEVDAQLMQVLSVPSEPVVVEK